MSAIILLAIVIIQINLLLVSSEGRIRHPLLRSGRTLFLIVDLQSDTSASLQIQPKVSSPPVLNGENSFSEIFVRAESVVINGGNNDLLR